jgi:LPPG:FO 2-phospho-L-lactate transferase
MLSVEPILQVQGIRAAIERRRVPCIAVSPIIGGQAVKGPAAKLMNELGLDASAAGVADYFGPLIDGLVMDTVDAVLTIKQRRLTTNTLMQNVDDRMRLANEILYWIADFTQGNKIS